MKGTKVGRALRSQFPFGLVGITDFLMWCLIGMVLLVAIPFRVSRYYRRRRKAVPFRQVLEGVAIPFRVSRYYRLRMVNCHVATVASRNSLSG